MIFVDDGSSKMILGPYIGDMTNELKKGKYITEFASTGPKSYAYVQNDGKQCCKIKG